MDKLNHIEWVNPELERLPVYADELDLEYWLDGPTGVHCLVMRGPLEAVNGYVGVSPNHPAHGMDYDSVRLHAHGGMTFSGCFEWIGKHGVPNDVWWWGFDCGHLYDLVPGMLRHGLEYNSPKNVYRDWNYVTNEVIDLVEQLDDGICLEPTA